MVFLGGALAGAALFHVGHAAADGGTGTTAGSGANGLTTQSDEAALLQRFQAAIADSRVAEAAEVNPSLFAIAEDNPRLVWRQMDGHREVLVASWMSPGKLKATFVGAEVDAAGLPVPGAVGAAVQGRDIWVTAVPQVQEFCAASRLSGPALELRLKQYLGLSPTWSYYGFAEMWVRPEDMYRPCPDPEIGDRTCTLATTVRGRYDQPVPSEYDQWYRKLESVSYGSDGAPWTRLGYTYDWGNPVSEVGASEYVLAAGASVALAQLAPAEAYCTGLAVGSGTTATK